MFEVSFRYVYIIRAHKITAKKYTADFRTKFGIIDNVADCTALVYSFGSILDSRLSSCRLYEVRSVVDIKAIC